MAGKGGFGTQHGGSDNMNTKLIDSPMSGKMLGTSGKGGKGMAKHTGSGRGRRSGHVGHMSGKGKY